MNTLAQASADRIKNKWLPDSLSSLSGAEFLGNLISLLITLGFIVGGITFVFMLITGALSIMTSGGDKAKAEQARARVTTAAIGLVILFAIFAVLNLIETVFGINLLLINLPSLVDSGTSGGGGIPASCTINCLDGQKCSAAGGSTNCSCYGSIITPGQVCHSSPL